MSVAADVAAALDGMAAAVRRGAFDEAASIGAAAPLPLAIDVAPLRLGAPLAAGPHSTVRPGTLPDGTPVAVKRVALRGPADGAAFRREAVAGAALARARHVAGLLAARALPPDYVLVTRLCAAGSVGDALRRGWRPAPAAAVALAADVAAGLAEMHAAGFVHRDVKPDNVLLDSDGRGLLCDLGVALHPGDAAAEDGGPVKPSGGHSKRHMIGTLEYMPPEVLLGGRASAAADVYAWSILTACLLTAAPPFSDCSKPAPDCHTVLEFGYGRHELATAVAGDGLRPRVAGADARARALLARAWAADPAARPAAADVAAAARALAGELAAEEAAAMAEEGGSVPEEPRGGDDAPTTRPPPLLPWAPPPAWPAPASTHTVAVSAAAFETAGARGADRMEDASIVAAPPRGLTLASDAPPVALLAVFDGHRGAGCALHAASTLEAHLSAAVRGGAAAPADALAAALLGADRSWRAREAAAAAAAAADGAPLPRPCGAAAAAALVWGGALAVANCGDVRAVLGFRAAPPSPALTPLRLSTDHAAASNPAEVARVRAAGGELVAAPDGSMRVAPVGLALTRSLGDADARAAGVIPDPATVTHTLRPGDAVLVIASDGLWDVASDGDVVGWVADTVKHPAMAAKRLATEAIARGSRDNVAVVVAYLEPVDTLEKVF